MSLLLYKTIENIAKMRLKKEVIERLRCRDNRFIRLRLAEELGVAPSSVPRWIYVNENNGRLTTVKALQIISEGLNIAINDILTE